MANSSEKRVQDVGLDANLDEIMEHIGWISTFTVRSYVIMFLVIVFGAMNIASSVFIAATMPHHCYVSNELQHNISQVCSLNWTDYQTNLAQPKGDKKQSQCSRYKPDELLSVNCSYWLNGGNISNITQEKCSSWSYDQSVFQSTIVSKFDLVCSDSWMLNISNFLLMVGIFFGALICGISADKWGRKITFSVVLIMLPTAAVLSSLFNNFWIYAVSRMFVGFSGIGLCVSGYVYAMETIGLKYRVVLGQTMQTTFPVGFMILALCAYFERRWFYLNLIVSLPVVILFLLYIWQCEESPRWLLSKNKPQKAHQVLTKMATVNGKTLDDFFADKVDKLQSPLVDEAKDIKRDTEPQSKNSTLDLFRNTTLLKISMVLFYNWFAVTCIYYGLTMNATTLAGNPFLNFFLVGLIEIPANYGAVFVIALWGRRPTLLLCNMFCGISLVSMMFVGEDQTGANLTLFLIGKFCSTATFSCIYLYSTELYPTPLRGNGVGLCSACARLGGMASQLIIMTSTVNPHLPYVVFGAISILAGALIIILPETKGTKLPETVEDTECLYNNRQLSLVKQFFPVSHCHCA